MIRRLAARVAVLAACLPAAAMAEDWALNGIDAVSYRADGAAIPGRNDIVTMWHGQAWHFVSEANRESFESNPRSYAPGLGGRCVVALAEGRSEPGDPRYFVVIDHRTYLTRSAAARDRLARQPEKILHAAEAVFSRMDQ